MSTGAIIAIIVVILIIAALLVGLSAMKRRRRLQDRFGPEYDRAVNEHGGRREAEAELAERERRVRQLDIKPLSPTARAQYASEWAAVQEQFVDAPQAAVAGAQTLVTAVMKDRGYPTEAFDQIVADLSVEHAATLDHFRAAHDISQRATSGTASTEELRQAMVHYRALFTELLGQPGNSARDARAAAAQPANEHHGQPANGQHHGQPANGQPATARDVAAPDRAADPDDEVTGEPISGSTVSGTPVPTRPQER
jgi:Tfp pilus assembly protein PilX